MQTKALTRFSSGFALDDDDEEEHGDPGHEDVHDFSQVKRGKQQHGSWKLSLTLL